MPPIPLDGRRVLVTGIANDRVKDNREAWPAFVMP